MRPYFTFVQRMELTYRIVWVIHDQPIGSQNCSTRVFPRKENVLESSRLYSWLVDATFDLSGLQNSKTNVVSYLWYAGGLHGLPDKIRWFVVACRTHYFCGRPVRWLTTEWPAAFQFLWLPVVHMALSVNKTLLECLRYVDIDSHII